MDFKKLRVLARDMKICTEVISDKILGDIDTIKAKADYVYNLLVKYGVNHDDNEAIEYLVDISNLCDKIKELL